MPSPNAGRTTTCSLVRLYRRAVLWISVTLTIAALFLLTRVAWPFDMVTPDFAFTERPDPSLPNVLIIGDSIAMKYVPIVTRALAGEANVYRPMQLAPQRAHSLFIGGPLKRAVNAASTSRGLERIDDWLGGTRWDVIHFNWGLHNLGAADTDVDAYRRELDSLVARMVETGARLVWASTTPVRDERVKPLNEAARDIMRSRGVAVNDLCAEIEPRKDDLLLPDGIHLREDGTELLAARVTEAIRDALARTPKEED